MDNKKIGKLIADLRKAKGLTQQDLGDMVGVGFRAVSKWERGITMPDISIINELSKILGITSDELLSGEINKETKSIKTNKVSNKIKITISIITVIILLITSTLLYLKNKTYVYEIISKNENEYIVEGKLMIQKKELTILLNKLYFLDKNFSKKTNIKDYEYEIYIKDKYMFGYSNNPESIIIDEITTIEEMTNNFRINYNGKNLIKRKDIINNEFTIVFKFVDKNNNIIVKSVECILY